MRPRVAGLLLAAGASARLGRPKQLVLWRGEPLLRRAARAALAGGLAPVVVVLGAGAAAAGAAVAGLPVTCVENADWAAGMGGSIRVGMAALGCAPAAPGPTAPREPSHGPDGVMVLVCDQPALDGAVVRLLVERWQGAAGATGTRVAACAYAGAVGVPALFGCAWFERLAALPSAQGARQLLAAADVLTVDFPGGAWDIDTPGDLPAGSE